MAKITVTTDDGTVIDVLEDKDDGIGYIDAEEMENLEDLAAAVRKAREVDSRNADCGYQN